MSTTMNLEELERKIITTQTPLAHHPSHEKMINPTGRGSEDRMPEEYEIIGHHACLYCLSLKRGAIIIGVWEIATYTFWLAIAMFLLISRKHNGILAEAIEIKPSFVDAFCAAGVFFALIYIGLGIFLLFGVRKRSKFLLRCWIVLFSTITSIEIITDAILYCKHKECSYFIMDIYLLFRFYFVYIIHGFADQIFVRKVVSKFTIRDVPGLILRPEYDTISVSPTKASDITEESVVTETTGSPTVKTSPSPA